jgi:hypothetical protein
VAGSSEAQCVGARARPQNPICIPGEALARSRASSEHDRRIDDGSRRNTSAAFNGPCETTAGRRTPVGLDRRVTMSRENGRPAWAPVSHAQESSLSQRAPSMWMFLPETIDFR